MHVKVEETAGAKEPEDGPRTAASKGGWVRDEGRWCAKQDWAPYQHPQTEPRPHRFLLRFFSTSGPALALPSRGQANLLFQSSCFNVLVALPPPLS